MKKKAADLQQLKGIGDRLATSLKQAGLDSFAKVAEADEEELRKVKGINPRILAGLREQAAELARLYESEPAPNFEALRQRLGEVKEQVQVLAENTRARFAEGLEGKCGKKLACELSRMEDTLGQLSFEGKKRARRAGKALDKARKRVGGLPEDASLKKVRKTLKRARKAVGKAVGKAVR